MQKGEGKNHLLSDGLEVPAFIDTLVYRMASVLNAPSEELVLILKGHLLIEEQVTSIIRQNVEDFAPLETARLSFDQKLRVAKAIGGELFSDASFDAARAINKMRNKIAHQPEPPDLQAMIDEFLADHGSYPALVEELKDYTTRRSKLKAMIAFLLGRFGSIVDSMPKDLEKKRMLVRAK